MINANKEIRTALGNALYTLTILLVCAACVFPFLWMVSISLKTRAQSYDPSIWFFTPTFENYRTVFQNRGIAKFLINSLIIAVGTTGISLVLGSLTAYGLARFDFKRKEDLAFWILSLRMLPPMAAVLPFFVMVSLLKVFDKHMVLIICYMLFNIPFTIWMMRSFFEEIPKELEESAQVDGCTFVQRIYKVVLPVAMPGIVATAIFCIIQSWNEFVFALFLTANNANTLPTTVQNFLSVSGVMWGEMSAVGVVSTAPMIIFAMLVQKHMIRGLTFGAVKG